MDFWMHGLGDKPEENARLLKEQGFKAVVAGDEESLDAALKSELDFYWFSGAFSYKDNFASEEYLAIDINGEKQEWFSSTCPSKKDVRYKNIEDIKKISKTKGIRGILIDGARFSSPASARSIDSFYTCFCEDCMKCAESFGIDSTAMKKSVKKLYDICHGKASSYGFCESYMSGILDWIKFRRISITEHLKNYVKSIKEADESLLAGIYIFTPTLASLVGQSYIDLAKEMDFFSPMIYRSFKGDDGPACLNFELAAIYEELSRGLNSKDRAIEVLRGLTGIDINENMRIELPVSSVELETKKAINLVTARKTAPIIQLDDEKLADSIDACRKAGANAVNFFMWDDKIMKNTDFDSMIKNGNEAE